MAALRGDRVVLRRGGPEDVDALLRILAEPEVAEWWGRYTAAEVRAELPDSYVIVVDDVVAGWLQYTEETAPDYPHVGLDIVVTTRLRDQGHGREALRVIVRHFVARGHHRFTIDPSRDNERAIRAYAAIGFRPVGVLRSYERAPGGAWRDGLLMDLLADELID
ncbi:MAG TPA: GNAT family protein [Baekduia sp.]|uniref:GNAT family N-acetyltransferase n=1 Tax=Baekduia sp. TaxID=2600305 RepID=UPI002C4F2CF7|nr:GNAT family protein [Baekduia sp.]HMJ34693.1 GNAT family protein [Baekduia sp.]